MNRFTTDISAQTVTIDGISYTADECRTSLPEAFRQQYGEESFHAALADFLAEWFNPSPTLCVHTSGSTGTPKKLWVEKRRMMNSAMMTVEFLGLCKGDSAMLCMPLQYIAGKMVVIRSLVAGLNLIPVAPCGHPMKDIPPTVFSAMIPMQVFNSYRRRRHRPFTGSNPEDFPEQRVEHLRDDGNLVAYRPAEA